MNTKIRSRSFTLYTDPGHGWLKVSKKMLRDLNVADKITQYSYTKNEYAYLEEDLDADTFLKAYYAVTGFTGIFIKCKHTNRSSRIRSYESYCPLTLG